MLYKVLLVGAGGFAGSIARYLAATAIDKRLNSHFPYGTLAVNLVGSFLLGILFAVLIKKTGTHSEGWKLFIGTGFCGGFTTFSAFAIQNVSLLEQKLAGTAMLYILLSMAGGLLAVWVGLMLGKNLV